MVILTLSANAPVAISTNIIGLVLGIVGLLQRRRKLLFPILGTALNMVLTSPVIVMLLFVGALAIFPEDRLRLL
jgi:hypothetical protein